MKRYLGLEICLKFFIIIGTDHSGYDCSGILQISADLVRVNFYGTVYLLRLALFSGLIGISTMEDTDQSFSVISYKPVAMTRLH